MLLLQQFKDGPDAPPAADHADIGQGIVQHFQQRLHIVLVTPGDQHNISVVVEGGLAVTQPVQFGAERAGDHLISAGEAGAVGELGPVIQDGDPKFTQLRHGGEWYGNVARTHND